MISLITPAFAEETPAATAPAADAAAPAATAPAAETAAPAAEHATTAEVGHEGGEAHGFPPFMPELYPSQLLWLALSFIVLYRIVSKTAAPQIASILKTRRDRIAGDLAEAERMRSETDAAIAAYEQSLADAKAKGGKIAAETREKVTKDIDGRRHEAEAVLTTRLTAAEAEIAATKAKAMADVNAVASEATVAIVSALIGAGNSDEASAAVAAVRS